ncbi:5-dehydro-4-deoxyglucarate dehydratase [Rudaeicoccus suwonensis]|uniref:5-dehydro-4-deoxyglucarate dehydratase n=1 Tax=Rudaeicoccus suwonensis TaxID=657409 RepID=A0A561EC80_9MICO|nr:5-dehydro-4-deoxyglucarate dehydratase [Rudaeicoccus suwonensis]TWE13213.1 5-dehydro-4-deoxyglucarate dehydratase [Rudaeicoccus suwonensis]
MSLQPQHTACTTTDPTLTGLLAFPLTAFDSALELDLDGCADNIDRQIAAGASAVFVACGTGEMSSLSSHEQLSIWKIATEVAKHRVPVWVGVGGGAATAREGMEAAHAAGADGALLLPPYLVTGPQTGLIDYVRYVTTGSTVPVVVYHRSTAVFTPQGATALLDLPAVIGLKDGYGSIDLMSRIVTGIRTSGHERAADFLFFNGLPTAEVSAAAYSVIDVARYSSAVHCFAPEIAHAFHDALADGDTDTTRSLLASFYLPLVQLRDESAGFAVSLVKAGAALRGHRVGNVRPPLVMPNAEQLHRLEAILDAGLTAVGATR